MNLLIFLIILTYFIIGFLCHLVFYAYKCYEYKYTKQKYIKQKCTWEYWSEHKDFDMMFIMFLLLWPITLCWYISFGIYTVITKKIRNYFGIK